MSSEEEKTRRSNFYNYGGLIPTIVAWNDIITTKRIILALVFISLRVLFLVIFFKFFDILKVLLPMT